MPDENFIAGIFNYCDRWCERCHLTARCAVFSMERESDNDAEHDITQGKFWTRLQGIFRETSEMLQRIAEEKGIDLSLVDPGNFNEEEEEQERERKKVRDNSLMQMAEEYQIFLADFLRLSETLSVINDNEVAMLEILTWYQFFIPAKIYRGLRFEEREDTDGSIKVALIAIDRSIMACYGLLNSANFTQLKPLIALLQILRQKCEEKFPGARDFVRPGFDEIDTVM